MRLARCLASLPRVVVAYILLTLTRHSTVIPHHKNFFQYLRVMFDPNLIDEYFPFEKFRPGQKECIEAILDAYNKGKRFVILEAPTGSGKSVIGMTVAKFFEKSYYLTIQKILQDQLARDFESESVKVLKGRNAYKCDFWDRWKVKHKDNPGMLSLMSKAAKDPVLKSTVNNPHLNCASGVCLLKDGKGKCAPCFPAGFQNTERSHCPYWKALSQGVHSATCIMNFHSFLYQTQVAERFEKRGLMIIDEAHNTEPQLMDFVCLSFTDRKFKKQGIEFPQFETGEEYAAFFEDNMLAEKIQDIIRIANYTRNFKEADEWKKVLLQYGIFIKGASSGEWIPKFEPMRGYNKITLKPIFVDKHANKYLFSLGDKVLMMSATILMPKVIYQSLGIDPSDAFAYRMKNRFPQENRPIYFQPSGSMSYKNKADTLPKLLKDIEKIASNFKAKRGIIHTHNFSICEYILLNCTASLKKRILFQKNYNTKDEMLKDHAKRSDGIIVAPAMHEGLDLKGDLARFQIICKVPYPSFQDNEQLKMRMQISDSYYGWLTALKLVQSYGRAIRSEDDWADTFILDADFDSFQRRNYKMLPKWFKQVIV